MEELEEDEEARKNINIYRNADKPIESDTDNEDLPKIDLSEMLEMVDLNKKDVEMNEWGINEWFTFETYEFSLAGIYLTSFPFWGSSNFTG